VYEENGIKFIDLDIKAEKSAVAASGAINKATATTFSVLYDGEETIIGGLYTTSDDIKRGGIPGLKDLPWWVFGLRYIFGFDQTTTITQEIIILIKADIIPTVEERIANSAKVRGSNLIDQAQKQNQSELERLRPKK
jgi:type IV pilus assembly protein PilQ